MSHSGHTLWSVLPPIGDVWITENHLWPSSGRCRIAMLALSNSFQCWWAPRKQSRHLSHQYSQWFTRPGFPRLAFCWFLSQQDLSLFHQTKRWRAMWASGPHRFRLSTRMWLHNTEGWTQKTQSVSWIDIPDCLPMSFWTRLGKQS